MPLTTKMNQEQSKEKCKRNRDNWKKEALRLREAIEKTIEENLHLADGDDCTLIRLKRALEYKAAQPCDTCEKIKYLHEALDTIRTLCFVSPMEADVEPVKVIIEYVNNVLREINENTKI